MQYITGIHALNLNCNLQTCGDWHQSAIQWDHPNIAESEGSLFGDYGIEHNKHIPGHTETYNTANHIRALLDLLQQGNFATAQGMNKDFICNDDYTYEIFNLVMKMKSLSIWNAIDGFMGKEYYSKWLYFKKKVNL